MKQIYFHIFSILFFCSFIINAQQNTIIANGTERPMNTQCIWINSEYMKWLKTDLPCSYDGNELLIAYFNADSTKITIEENSMDNLEYTISKIGNNKFQDAENSEVLMEIIKDTLYLSTSYDKIKFEKYPMAKLIGCSSYLGKVNILFLEEILSKYGFNLFDRLDLSNNCNLYCNRELNNINIISDADNINNKWIIEKKDSCFYVYKYLNLPKTKMINPIIKKELRYKICTY